ncbi:MAG: hypothetical protein P8020_06595 [Acidobacteriota bacterium]
MLRRSWLYGLSLLFIFAASPSYAEGNERIVIDLGLAALIPHPQVVTAASLPSFIAAGPFLADYDGDGILEADIDADGFEATDPEVKDYDGDVTTRELPPNTVFQGRKNYTSIWSPSDVLIKSSGPLELYSLTDIRIFGAVRLAASTTLAARGVVDLRASAWLMDDAAGTLTVRSALAGVTGHLLPDIIDESGNLSDLRDSDQDGIADVDEGKGDADADGVADWLDQDTLSVKASTGFRSQMDLHEGDAQRLDWQGSRLLSEDDASLPAAGRPSVPFPFGMLELSAIGGTAGEEFQIFPSFPIVPPSTARFWAIDKNQAWIPLTADSVDGKAVLEVPDGGSLDLDGQADGRLTFRVGLGISPLLFSQFGDGLGQLSSQVLILNLDRQNPAHVDLRLNDDKGAPLVTDLDGGQIQGEHSIVVPPAGVRSLASDGIGDLKVGSLAAFGDHALSGVILFRGPAGLAGVGAAEPLPDGFLAPIETNVATDLDTGIAVMNPSDQERQLNLTLFDTGGHSVATAETKIPALGHLARFAYQFDWQPSVSLSSFMGQLRVDSDGLLAATVLQTRPGEFVTLPVVPLGSSPNTGNSLYFAHFGAGADSLLSEIILFNLDANDSADATIWMRNDDGQVPRIKLNGEPVGTYGYVVTIPPRGLKILSTGMEGDLVAGSVQVASLKPLAGVIVFSGTVGAAGVGSSPMITDGFSAPMETDLAHGLNTGIAVMNLGYVAAPLNLTLYDENGGFVAQATTSSPLKINGHTARYVTDFNWDSDVDFARFRGSLRVSSPVPIAATVLQTRPGQYATMPVAISN